MIKCDSMRLWLDMFPGADTADLFWDDDYEDGMNFNTWLRRKYSGPYHFFGFDDNYPENQLMIEDLKRRYPRMDVIKPFNWNEKDDFREDKDENPTFKTKAPEIEKTIKTMDATMEEANRFNVYMEQPFNYLLERLSVADIFTACPVDMKGWTGSQSSIEKTL